MSKSSHFNVPASYLAAFIDDLAPGDAEQAELLASMDLRQDQLRGNDLTLPLDRVLAILRLIDGQAPSGWHIGPVLRLEAAHHGPLGIAVVTAATIGDALETLVRYEPTRAPWAMLAARRCGKTLTLTVVPTISLEPPGALLMEINLLALTSLCSGLLGRHHRLLETTFPDHYRSWEGTLRTSLPGSISFRGQHYMLGVPADQLARRCHTADAGLHASAVARCDGLLNNRGGGSLAARIRRQLFEADGQAPGLEAMAQRLNLSPRSLNRHLASRGTGYQVLVDEVRLALAQDLLWHSDLPIASIAERLGYSDPANFGRAVRRWSGKTPGQLRRTGPFR